MAILVMLFQSYTLCLCWLYIVILNVSDNKWEHSERVASRNIKSLQICSIFQCMGWYDRKTIGTNYHSYMVYIMRELLLTVRCHKLQTWKNRWLFDVVHPASAVIQVTARYVVAPDGTSPAKCTENCWWNARWGCSKRIVMAENRKRYQLS